MTFSHLQLNWFKAQQTCLRNGARLATIDTVADLALIDKNLKALQQTVNITNKPSFWLSGNDLTQEDAFWWLSNGKAMNMSDSFWETKQPDNKNNQPQCVVLGKPLLSTKFMFHDVGCVLKRHYICEASPLTA